MDFEDTNGKKEKIVEKIEKEVIVDDVEEWPSDVMAHVTEITKIKETHTTEKPQMPVPAAVNGDARRLMERLNYFLESVESVDARRELNEIKKSITDALLTLQIEDEKMDSLKKRVASLEGINLALDELRSGIERKMASLENKLVEHDESAERRYELSAGRIKTEELDGIKYALAEMRDFLIAQGRDEGIVKELNAVKSELSALSKKPIEEELVNISFRLENLKNFLDSMEVEEIQNTVKDLYKEIDLLGSMIDEKITDIKSKLDARMQSIEEQIGGVQSSMAGAERMVSMIEEAGSKLSTNSDRIQGVADNISLLSENLQSKLDVISSSSQEVEEARKNLVKSSNELMDKEEETRRALLASGSAVVDTVTDEIRRMDKRTQRTGAALQRTASQLAKKSIEAKKLEREVARMNLRFAKLDEIDILIKIAEIKKSTRKKKLPGWAKKRRDDIEKELRRLEDEAIDIAIARELRTAMTVTELKKKVNYSTSKLKERINSLAKEGLVTQEKKGKRTIYTAVK